MTFSVSPEQAYEIFKNVAGHLQARALSPSDQSVTDICRRVLGMDRAESATAPFSAQQIPATPTESSMATVAEHMSEVVKCLHYFETKDLLPFMPDFLYAASHLKTATRMYEQEQASKDELPDVSVGELGQNIESLCGKWMKDLANHPEELEKLLQNESIKEYVLKGMENLWNELRETGQALQPEAPTTPWTPPEPGSEAERLTTFFQLQNYVRSLEQERSENIAFLKTRILEAGKEGSPIPNAENCLALIQDYEAFIQSGSRLNTTTATKVVQLQNFLMSSLSPVWQRFVPSLYGNLGRVKELIAMGYGKEEGTVLQEAEKFLTTLSQINPATISTLRRIDSTIQNQLASCTKALEERRAEYNKKIVDARLLLPQIGAITSIEEARSFCKSEKELPLALAPSPQKPVEDTASGIDRVMKSFMEEYIPWLRATGMTQKATVRIGPDKTLTLKARYRAERIEIVVKERLGKGTYKYVFEYRILQSTGEPAEQPYAYAKIKKDEIMRRHELKIAALKNDYERQINRARTSKERQFLIQTYEQNLRNLEYNLKKEIEENIEAFKREAMISKEILRSSPGIEPNVLAIREVYKLKNPTEIKGLMMELCLGGMLFRKTETHGIPEHYWIPYMKEIARGLCQIHKADWCHMDLKTGNILLKEQNSGIKICDLGAAMKLGEEYRSTVTTYTYAPPEALFGDRKYASKAVDMWSLGMILFELKRGWPSNLFSRLSDEQFSGSSQTAEWKNAYNVLIRQLNRSDPIDNLISRLLSIDPAQRPTAEEALRELEALGPTALG